MSIHYDLPEIETPVFEREYNNYETEIETFNQRAVDIQEKYDTVEEKNKLTKQDQKFKCEDLQQINKKKHLDENICHSYKNPINVSSMAQFKQKECVLTRGVRWDQSEKKCKPKTYNSKQYGNKSMYQYRIDHNRKPQLPELNKTEFTKRYYHGKSPLINMKKNIYTEIFDFMDEEDKNKIWSKKTLINKAYEKYKEIMNKSDKTNTNESDQTNTNESDQTNTLDLLKTWSANNLEQANELKKRISLIPEYCD